MAMMRMIIYMGAGLFAILVFPLLILILFFSSPVDRWLAVHDPVRAEVLVVEGWTSHGLTEKVAKEFHSGDYKFILTTGGPMDEVYNMSQNGAIIFDLARAGARWEKGDTAGVILYAFGEPAMGEYARYTIVHQSDTIGSGYTTGRMKAISYEYFVEDEPSGKISVIYDNDHITRDEDRNLHIWKIETGGVEIPVRSEYTWLSRRTGSEPRERPLNQLTLAEEKTFLLTAAGIDSSRVITLDIPHVRRLRTFTDAVMVNEWLTGNGLMPGAVNIFSQGNHARRSRLLYLYALPDSVEIGVISTAEYPDHYSRLSSFSTIRQFGAYMYTRIFFNPRWHYRRIMRLRDTSAT